MSIVPLNITLPPASGSWTYSPRRKDTAWSASFTGTPRSDGGADGAMYFKTQLEHSTVSLNFTGTQLLLCISLNGSQTQVKVNGGVVDSLVQINDPACSSLGATHTLSTGALSPGDSRTVELELLSISGDQVIQFFGGIAMVNVDVGSTPDATLNELKIDDRDRDWELHPGFTPVDGVRQWIFENNTAAAYEGTRSVNCIYIDNTLATRQFNGASAVLLNGYLDANTRYYSIVFDGQMYKADASTFGWRVGTAPLFLKTGLDPAKTYKIGYSNFNEDERTCPTDQMCCASLDMLHLFGSSATLIGSSPVHSASSASPSATETVGQASAPPTSGPMPPVAVIVGATFSVIIGICAFAILGFWYWRCNRVRRRRGHRELNLDTGVPREKVHLDATIGWNPHGAAELAPGPVHPAPASGSSSRPEKGWAVKPLPRREIDPVVEPSGPVLPAEPGAPPSSPTATSTVHSADVDRLMRLVVARLGIPSRPTRNETRPPSYLTERRSEPNAAFVPL